MNRIYYDEHRPGHRRCALYYQRTMAIGLVALGIALYIGAARFPDVGPGWFANAGLTASGLLLLWGVRKLQRDTPVTRWGRWIARRMNDLFPALLVGLQGWFVLLAALLLWYTILELGLPAGPFDTGVLVAILALAPLRRILAGTEPPNPAPARAAWATGLRLLNVALIAIFSARALSELTRPPPGGDLPLFPILVWIAATLVVLACVILFIDFWVRKMPQSPPGTPADKLE